MCSAMTFKKGFTVPLALSSVVSVGMILYAKEIVQDMISFRDYTDFYSSTQSFAYNSKRDDYIGERTTTQKPFVYLTETEQCLPRNLASSSEIGDPETCNCDVIVLSFRAKCQENNQSHITYLFDANTLFASGRNVLFFAALDKRPGYHYYIFVNDDTFLEFNEFTPANMTEMSPFPAVENWLLDYEPAVGVLDYKAFFGASSLMKIRRELCGINESSLVLPTVMFDGLFNAFHHKAVEHVLPYPTQYERGCITASNRDTIIAVEVKFGGQALLFAPVTAGNPKHREYDRSVHNFWELVREFIARIKEEAPPTLRSHVIFEMLLADPRRYLISESRSFCANVTQHQPIVPYMHLLNDV